MQFAVITSLRPGLSISYQIQDLKAPLFLGSGVHPETFVVLVKSTVLVLVTRDVDVVTDVDVSTCVTVVLKLIVFVTLDVSVVEEVKFTTDVERTSDMDVFTLVLRTVFVDVK